MFPLDIMYHKKRVINAWTLFHIVLTWHNMFKGQNSSFYDLHLVWVFDSLSIIQVLPSILKTCLFMMPLIPSPRLRYPLIVSVVWKWSTGFRLEYIEERLEIWDMAYRFIGSFSSRRIQCGIFCKLQSSIALCNKCTRLLISFVEISIPKKNFVGTLISTIWLVCMWHILWAIIACIDYTSLM